MQERADVYSANRVGGVSVSKEVKFVYGTQEQYDKLSDDYTWGALNSVSVSHIVKEGESWESIAGLYSVPVIVLQSQNKEIKELPNRTVLVIK